MEPAKRIREPVWLEPSTGPEANLFRLTVRLLLVGPFPASDRSRLAPVRECSKDRIKHCIESPAHVRREEPQHQVAMFLEQQVLAPIAAIRVFAVEMLRSVHLDRHTGVNTEQVDFHAAGTVEWDWQRGIETESASRFG